MNLKSMKHLKNNNGSWYYQRRWPKALLGHPQVKTCHYSRPLGVEGVDETQLAAAWQHQHRICEDYIGLLLLANKDAIDAKREIEMALALLEANNLKPGMLHPTNPLRTDEQNAAVVEAAEYIVDESGLFYDRERERVSPQINILDRAWKFLREPASESHKLIITLADCWDAYQAEKHLNLKERQPKKVLSRWMQYLELVGDTVVTQEFINHSLRQYLDHRTGKVQPSSVERELKTICPILRVGVEHYNLPYDVKKPRVTGGSNFKERYVLTPDEQLELLSLAQDAAQKAYKPWKEAALLLMIQTGCNTSELQRLKLKNVDLDGDVPYVVIAGETKTKHRERVVPVVVAVERLRKLVKQLGDESGFAIGNEFASKNESNVSHQLKTVIKKVNPEATAYSLRHAVRNNALAAGVDDATTSMIGGWSSQLAVNPIQQQYGSGGRLYPETLKHLQGAMLKINHHLIEESCSNVLSISSMRKKRGADNV